MSVLLSALSALCYGAGDYIGGRATRQSRVFSILLLSQFVGLVGILIAAPLFGGAVVRPEDLLWGAAAGASGVLGLALLYRALATSVAAIASPLAALVGAAAPVIVGAATGEQPGLTGWLGIGIAIPAVFMLTAQRRAGENPERAVIYGFLAGLGFGGFFVFIAQSSPDSGLWALAGSKVAGMTLSVAIHAATRTKLHVARSARVPAIAAGLLDMAANVFFLLASRIGLLAVTGVISSLYPAPTVMLAAVIDRQKLTALRIAGLVLAIAGVSLMTA